MGAAGSDVHHHPPRQRAWPGWGLAALAVPVLWGLVSRVADPLWGRAGSSGSAGVGFPRGWCRGMGASRATSQPGCQPAGMPHHLSCCQLPARLIVTWSALGGRRPPSPSLGVTLGRCGVSVPSCAWVPPRPAAATRAGASQWRCSSSKTPLPNQKSPLISPPDAHSCRRAPRQQVSSCWDWGGRTGLTQPGLCRCPHGAGQCRSQG